MVNFKKFGTLLVPEKGFKMYWDDVANAPYAYNATEKLFITYDDRRSMELKTNYVADQRLNGIMFWEITNDTYTDSLLETINRVKKKRKTK